MTIGGSLSQQCSYHWSQRSQDHQEAWGWNFGFQLMEDVPSPINYKFYLLNSPCLLNFKEQDPYLTNGIHDAFMSQKQFSIIYKS